MIISIVAEEKLSKKLLRNILVQSGSHSFNIGMFTKFTRDEIEEELGFKLDDVIEGRFEDYVSGMPDLNESIGCINVIMDFVDVYSVTKAKSNYINARMIMDSLKGINGISVNCICITNDIDNSFRMEHIEVIYSASDAIVKR